MRRFTFLRSTLAHRLLAVATTTAVSAAASLALPLAAQAQADYPNKPINIIVGYPPGGSVDLTGRVVADILSKQLKATTVVENVGGAGGTLGAQKAASAAPDGYTLLLGSANELAISRLVNAAVKYDGVKDFTPIGLIGSQPLVLVASQKTGVKNTDEFLKTVKSSPGKLSYGSSGVGTSLHLAGEMVKEKSGTFMVHIPYRGVAPLTNDLLGNNLEFGMFVLSSGLPHIKSGKVVALGVTEAKRSKIAPEIPALGEHPQLSGLDIGVWFALMAPKNLPQPVQAKLQKALQDGLQDPAIRKRLEDSGATLYSGKEDTTAFMTSETAKFKKIVDYAKIKE
jgi:tripartite-type tricarboxylate transporter receptor subunit TctC